jgi:hypothetical protein
MELGMEIDGELVVARELLKKCFQVWASHWKSAAFVRSFYALPRFPAPTPDFDRRCLESWVSDADVNDVRQRMLKNCPRRSWLQLNGDPKGECYAPFLCVCYWVGMPYVEFLEVLGLDLGRHLAWGLRGRKAFVHRQRDGLQRHSAFLTRALWIWFDPSGADPYATPGS